MHRGAGRRRPPPLFEREEVTAETTCEGICTFDAHDFGGHLWLPIDHRRTAVQNQATPGHFEGDRIKGPGNASAVSVLVARTTRFMRLYDLPKQDATSVRAAFERTLADLPSPWRLSLTYDPGQPMAERAQLGADLLLKLSFYDAHSPSSRATCGSQNDHLRHDLPATSRP